MLETLFFLGAAPSLIFLPALVSFPLFAWVATWPFNRSKRYSEVPFALVNLLGAFVLCLSATQAVLKANYPDGATFRATLAPFLGYIAVVLVSYALLCRSKTKSGGWTLAALWAPILILIVVKYLPIYGMLPLSKALARLFPNPELVFVGLSYLSFRLSYLVQEVQNGVVELPNVWDYVSFAFFVPTLVVGPISPFRLFIGTLRNPDRSRTPMGRSLQRIVVGLTKYIFFSTLLSQVCYRSLLLDGHPHAKVDLAVAVLAYPLYLYCNFSGLCDMVIGISGMMGIAVMENFDHPFYSRNFQVFWSRWHISLSTFMRDMMFTPLVKFLAARFGSKNLTHAIALSILSVFLVIGVWHGTGINFALFGLSQGLGVVAVHYSTIFLKKRLGKAGFIAYQQNRFIYVIACACTYLYFALTAIFFANSWEEMGKIFATLTLKS
jgi:D-alanyl-lipoteichoic acid acyltransferase DltB (MBOAT superfamily)